jgi:hypothetical protein
MRILRTLRVVGMNTPYIVPIFSALSGFPFFIVSGVLLPLHLTLSGLQKRLLLAGVCASIFTPVEKGPGSDNGRETSTEWSEENILNGDSRDRKNDDIRGRGDCCSGYVVIGMKLKDIHLTKLIMTRLGARLTLTRILI